MRKYSKSDILKMAKEEHVGYVRLQFTDMFGTLKIYAEIVSVVFAVYSNNGTSEFYAGLNPEEGA